MTDDELDDMIALARAAGASWHTLTARWFDACSRVRALGIGEPLVHPISEQAAHDSLEMTLPTWTARWAPALDVCIRDDYKVAHSRWRRAQKRAEKMSR